MSETLTVEPLDVPVVLGDLAMAGAGNCPDLRACMRDACTGQCTDSPPEPEPNAA